MIVLSCPGCTGPELCIACEHEANRGRRGLRVDPRLCTECGARLVGVQRITCTDCTFRTQGVASASHPRSLLALTERKAS